MQKKKYLIIISASWLLSAMAWYWIKTTREEKSAETKPQIGTTEDFAALPNGAAASPESKGPVMRTVAAVIERGRTLSDALADLGVRQPHTHSLVQAIRSVINPRRIMAGTSVQASFQAGTPDMPETLELRLSETKILAVRAEPAEGEGVMPNWRAELRDLPVETKKTAFSGVVTSSLWNSATSAGMDPGLITSMTEIFAWMLDFNREVQPNDRWRLVVEQLFVEGRPFGYGNILAAEYENNGTMYTAVHYEGEQTRGQYFAPDGNSLRRMFLKSPLKFGHITSGFSAQRFHPILKVNKPHLGVDYGAPTGTPVMSVGDGVVHFAASKGASGKTVSVRHNSVYVTQYKHLSRFAEGVTPGAKVSMGQVIGYVGSTGLATGPHLHFEFHTGGRVVDPQGLKFPTADPVPASDLDNFRELAEVRLADLPPWSKAVLTEQADKAGEDTVQQ